MDFEVFVGHFSCITNIDNWFSVPIGVCGSFYGSISDNRLAMHWFSLPAVLAAMYSVACVLVITNLVILVHH